MIDGILHLTGSNCRVVFLKNKLFVTQNKHRNELHERKAAGDPLEPLQSMLICRGPLVLRSRIKAIIFRCFSDRHLNIDRRGCRGLGVLTSSVFRFIFSLQIQSPICISIFTIGTFARSTVIRTWLAAHVFEWPPMSRDSVHPV